MWNTHWGQSYLCYYSRVASSTPSGKWNKGIERERDTTWHYATLCDTMRHYWTHIVTIGQDACNTRNINVKLGDAPETKPGNCAVAREGLRIIACSDLFEAKIVRRMTTEEIHWWEQSRIDETRDDFTKAEWSLAVRSNNSMLERQKGDRAREIQQRESGNDTEIARY